MNWRIIERYANLPSQFHPAYLVRAHSKALSKQTRLMSIQLQELCESLALEFPESLDYDTLCGWVEAKDWRGSDWKTHVPPMDNAKDYARNILCLDPFEVVLLHWPPGVESAVHHHEGFWGAVVCLEGELENINYELTDGVLREKDSLKALPTGIVPEPDGTIHKIRNASREYPLVTLHFYSPALADLDGLVLYDLETLKMFVCNELAPTASLDLPASKYRSIAENAFVYDPLPDASHIQCNVVPKPLAEEIERMVLAYFSEQANQYDALDEQIQKRKLYTAAIDQRVAVGLQQLNERRPIERVMHLACGTGRRASDIKDTSGLNYEMLGVDLCDAMASQARKRDLEVQVASLRDPASFVNEGRCDAVTLLYAYGHLPNRKTRENVINAAFRMLKPGGTFFFDAFDAQDEFEWGPEAVSQFHEQRLGQQGYEEGDVFYRRATGEHLAFLHYCSSDRLFHLMEAAGFVGIEMTTIGYDQSVGAESHNGKLFVAGTRPA